MSHHFAKPENALKRAEELLHVGQQTAALDSLHDVLSSKRHRTWTPVIEQVITKYLDICITLKKGRMAKDGLIQYRIICQQINVGSLDDVLRALMAKVDAAASGAIGDAEGVTQSIAVSDLDADETPESILLSAMTGDDSATRTERETVTPWLKFMWETYRTVLEILRSNNKLEGLYAETASKAFAFCVKYKRATEMRRLCELLRNHLSALSKYQPREAQAAGLPADGLSMHLEVRYSQLNAAADLELWQECYRTIEDIHALSLTLKKPPKTSMQLNYYLKLSQVFLVSDNLLLHAYCLMRLVTLTRSKKAAPDSAELRSLATAALLAAAVAPLSPHAAQAGVAPGAGATLATSLDLDLDVEKHRRIASVLGFGSLPSRDSLLAELRAKGVLALAEPAVAKLVGQLEATHVPTAMARDAEGVLAWLAADARCAVYGQLLRKQVALRALQQMARVYTAISVEKAVKLMRVLPAADAELVLARAVKRGLVAASVDAAEGVLRFGGASLDKDAGLRMALSTVFSAVCKAATAAARDAVGADAQTVRKEAARVASLAALSTGAGGEHARMLQRKLVIERRKEELERVARQEENARKAAADLEAAELRLETDAKRRAVERSGRERDEEDNVAKRKLAEVLAEQRKTLLAKSTMKKKVWDIETDVDKLVEMPTNMLVNEQRELVADERAEFEKRLETLRKRADYLERARREAETPLLQAHAEYRLRADRETHERAVRKFVESAQVARVHGLEQRARLGKVAADKVPLLSFERLVVAVVISA
ncbi:hypothetical protein T492DRAFT_467308 [Pavlovales sp. CCMP2436]|nr:hypothetical protein T492DRAFT_467308 [Pavlovales sp. CCMP2436]